MSVSLDVPGWMEGFHIAGGDADGQNRAGGYSVAPGEGYVVLSFVSLESVLTEPNLDMRERDQEWQHEEVAMLTRAWYYSHIIPTTSTHISAQVHVYMSTALICTGYHEHLL